jgi:hypothetical protein
MDIAKELKELRMQRVTLREEVKNLDRWIKEREAFLTPAGGWPGKNPDERKAAQVDAYKFDGDLVEFGERLLRAKFVLDQNEAALDSLKDEQNAIEWTIRDNSNMILGSASVYQAMMDEVTNMLRDAATQEMVKEINADETWPDDTPTHEAPGPMEPGEWENENQWTHPDEQPSVEDLMTDETPLHGEDAPVSSDGSDPDLPF